MFRTFLAMVVLASASVVSAEQLVRENSFFMYQGSGGQLSDPHFERFDPAWGTLHNVTIDFYDVTFTWTEMGLTGMNPNDPEPVEFQAFGDLDVGITIPLLPSFQEYRNETVASNTLTVLEGEWGNINYDPAYDILDPEGYRYTQSVDFSDIIMDTNLNFAIGYGDWSVTLTSNRFFYNLFRNGQHFNGPFHKTDLPDNYSGELAGNMRIVYDFSPPEQALPTPEPSSLLSAVVGVVFAALGLLRHFR